MRGARYLALAAALLLAPAAARANTSIVLLYTAVSGYLGAFVAQDQGFFARRGLDVTLTQVTNGSTIPPALVSNSAQIGTPTPTIFITAIDNGLDLVALAATNAYPEGSRSGIVARPAANITGPAALAGKRIGVPGIGGLIDVLVRNWLLDNKVDPKQVTFIEIGFPSMPDALRNGAVDAVGSVDPFLSRAVDAGNVYVGSYIDVLPAGTVATVFAATRAWADANPAATAAFQGAIAEAVGFAQAHQTEAKESAAKWTKLPPAAVLAQPMPNVIAQVSPESLAPWIGILRRQNLITGTPDPAHMIAPWRPAN